jgi:O-antigen/teichoic acid export membrane protein
VQLGPLVPGVLVTSVFALAARFADRDRERLRLFVREFASVVALLLPLPLLALAVPSADVIGFFYGDAYADAAPLLAILALAVTLMIASGVAGPLLVALGRERSTMFISAGAAALNVAANVVLIPLLDARGAALATVGTEVVVLLAASVILARALRPRLDGAQLAKIALAGLAGAVVVWALPGHVLVRIAAGVILYVGLLVATRAVGRRQLELTRAAPPATSIVA